MRRLIPRVHTTQSGVVLMDHQYLRLSDDGQRRVGHHQRNFDDAIAVRPEAGHLHVDPDQSGCVLRHQLLCDLA